MTRGYWHIRFWCLWHLQSLFAWLRLRRLADWALQWLVHAEWTCDALEVRK